MFLPLLAGLNTLSLVWAFIQISSEMAEGDTRSVVEVMRGFSGLGSIDVEALSTSLW